MTDWSDEKITALMANEADRCAARIVAALDRGNLPTGNSDVESAIKRAIQRVEDRAIAAEARESETMRGLDAAIARAEKAETSLAEWHGVEAVGPIAGRWCLASERDDAVNKLAGAVHAVADAFATLDEVEARAEAAEAREWALGVQVVAQAARLRLADDVVSAARALVSRTAGRPRRADDVAVHHALAAWDAVPGDNKAPT